MGRKTVRFEEVAVFPAEEHKSTASGTMDMYFLDEYRKRRNMTKKISIIQKVIAHILGNKYWLCIVNRRGTDRVDISGYIFRTREEAEEYKMSLEGNASFRFVEMHSFRSRSKFLLLTDNLGTRYNRCTFVGR